MGGGGSEWGKGEWRAEWGGVNGGEVNGGVN